MASMQHTKRLRLASTSEQAASTGTFDVIETSLEDDECGDIKSKLSIDKCNSSSSSSAAAAAAAATKDLLADLDEALSAMPKSSSNGNLANRNKPRSTQRRPAASRSRPLRLDEDVDNLSDETEGEADADYEEDEEEDDDEDDDDEDEDDEEEEDEDGATEEDGSEDEEQNKSKVRTKKQRKRHQSQETGAASNTSLQKKLAASGPAGVAAAAAIATVRKRRRPHTFETNPSVRKRQQTRLIRKLRACIDEYTARVGQQAVVLITMPGKTAHNFKVFGAQPLESVVRSCKQEIMSELEQAVLEQTPMRHGREADESGKHELPPLVIDGIPTPVEKMTQAQLRAFIPLMLKYSTGRGKPGWGKESTRPPWWPNTLPWANVRSDARDDVSKQCISWTTTLREIVTNCYKFHGREDLLPIFDEENDERAASDSDELLEGRGHSASSTRRSANNEQLQQSQRSNGTSTFGSLRGTQNGRSQRPLGSASTRAAARQQRAIHSGAIYTTASEQFVTANQQQQQQQQHHQGNFMQTIQNPDGSVSLIQVDPANAQILTLPDGTQVRAVRLQTMATSGGGSGENDGQTQQLIATTAGNAGELHTLVESQFQSAAPGGAGSEHQLLEGQQAELGADGQIILTSEDGTQSCYPMSQLVSIPASVYQQFAASGQPLQIISADGASLSATNAIQIHTLEEAQEISAAEAANVDQLQQVVMDDQQQQQQAAADQESTSVEQKVESSAGSRQANEKQRSQSGRFFSHS